MPLRLKALLRRFAPYDLYHIYSIPPDSKIAVPRCDPSVSLRDLAGAGDFAAGADVAIRSMTEYARPSEAFAFGAYSGESLVAACWYWAGETYRARGFWPLRDGEAKLIQIATASDLRGRGIAAALAAYSASRMQENGYRALYARVWHSHLASCRALEKAGWRRTAFVGQVNLPGMAKPIRFVRRTSGASTAK